MECLHHQKEFARNKAIKDEMKRQEREKKDNAASEEVGVDSSG